jgi:hypothetical protein
VQPATFYLPTTRGVRGCVVAMCSPRKSRESNATSRMRLGVPLLLVEVMLCCLALLTSLPATTAPGMSEVPSALAGAEEGGGVNAPLPDGSYSWTPAEEAKKMDKRPIDAFLLTMLVLVTVASFGASVLSPLTMNARKRWEAICPWDVEVRPWLAATREKPSFLGVFRL